MKGTEIFNKIPHQKLARKFMVHAFLDRPFKMTGRKVSRRRSLRLALTAVASTFLYVWRLPVSRSSCVTGSPWYHCLRMQCSYPILPSDNLVQPPIRSASRSLSVKKTIDDRKVLCFFNDLSLTLRLFPWQLTCCHILVYGHFKQK